MKTIANHPSHTFETGGSSSATPSRPAKKRDPYFTPELQASRLVRFHGIKLAYVRYADVPWLGKLIVLDEKLFLAVGGLSCSSEPLGNCENEQSNDFEALATYRSCLRDNVKVTPGGLTKVGSLTRNTNHAQPTTNDLKMIFSIKQGILVNWPAEILKVMSGIATLSTRLLTYEIFISRVIDHMDIDTSDVEIKLTNTHDHQVGEYLIHKMGTYKITSTWMYQEDYRTTVDLDLLDEETTATQQEQPIAPPEVPEASPPFGLAHLDALEQRLNQRVDAGIQALNDNMDSGITLNASATQKKGGGEIEIASISQIATSVSCLCFEEDKAYLKSLNTGRINIQHDQDSDFRKIIDYYNSLID
ncbi:hypothetical protein Lal_00042491 [Lupinus albus]|nr:hypothetical protein Lal_00042491 [Lupinus albus]